MPTYYSTSLWGDLSASPYGALMYARATKSKDICVHDIIDVELPEQSKGYIGTHYNIESDLSKALYHVPMGKYKRIGKCKQCYPIKWVPNGDCLGHIPPGASVDY